MMPARTTAEWASFATNLPWSSDLVIGGSVTPPLDGGEREMHAPRDGRVFARAPWAGVADVDRAVAAARSAFDDGRWPRMAPKERKERLLALAALIERDRDILAAMISMEMGKPISHAWQIELRAVIQTYRWYAELADKELDESSPVGDDALALITREPVGVVGVVTPWNFPLTLSAWKIAPALAVGCTVVHKPSELAPFSALHIAQLALEADIPASVLNVVTGDGRELGGHVGRHLDVDALAFTGSTPVGRAYLEYAAQSNLKRTWLELGGKSANIILPDAPSLEDAARTAAWGITFNSGQMCTAPSRLIVHDAVADEVIDRVVAEVARTRAGDPMDPDVELGPLVSMDRVQHVQGIVRRAVEHGATRATDEALPQIDASLVGGSYVEPVVFTSVDPDSELARDEVFGPVLAVFRVSSEDQAVRMANDSAYGLAAGLWTSDVSRVHRISRQLRAGTVWVNCYEEGDLTVPFGGYKLSGNGRDKSRHALEKYSELKTTYVHL